MFANLGSGIKHLILNAIHVWNYVNPVIMECNVIPVSLVLIEKVTYVIVRSDSMMMILSFANHVQYIVILVKELLIHVLNVQLILIELKQIATVLMDFMIMEKLFVLNAYLIAKLV